MILFDISGFETWLYVNRQYFVPNLRCKSNLHFSGSTTASKLPSLRSLTAEYTPAPHSIRDHDPGFMVSQGSKQVDHSLHIA